MKNAKRAPITRRFLIVATIATLVLSPVQATNYFSSYQAGASHFVFKEGSGYGFSINQPEAVMLISAGQAMSLAGADQAPVVRPATEAEIPHHSEDTDAGDPDGDQDNFDEQGDYRESPGDKPPQSGDDSADDGRDGDQSESISEESMYDDADPEPADNVLDYDILRDHDPSDPVPEGGEYDDGRPAPAAPVPEGYYAPSDSVTEGTGEPASRKLGNFFDEEIYIRIVYVIVISDSDFLPPQIDDHRRFFDGLGGDVDTSDTLEQE